MNGVQEFIDGKKLRCRNQVMVCPKDRYHDWAIQEIHRELRERTAEFLREQRLVKKEEEFHTTYTLDLYVMSPSEFWELVSKIRNEGDMGGPLLQWEQ